MTRGHIAEVISLLGPPPLELLQQGERSHEFFAEDGMPATDPQTRYEAGLMDHTGEWKADIEVPQGRSLENTVTRLEGEEKRAFLEFVRGMLQWRPEDQETAAQLAEDPWLRS